MAEEPKQGRSVRWQSDPGEHEQSVSVSSGLKRRSGFEYLSSRVNVTPSLQDAARKTGALRVSVLIRMQPAHKIAHVPPNLASVRPVAHAKDPSWRRAGKQHHAQNVEVNDGDNCVLVEAR
jgi:hypothetical protein